MTSFFGAEQIVESWGRVKRPLQSIARPMFIDEVPAILTARNGRNVLAVGLRRSYGDSNLNTNGHLIDMTRLDKLVSFDSATGILKAEAGLPIGDALQVTVPLGWFFKTSPGTRNVTLGGAIANDVHGKNQHTAGSFGNGLRRMTIVRSDGQQLQVSPQSGDMFAATIGGLGLTGIITSVEVEMTKIGSAYVDVERIPFSNVRDFHQLARQSLSYEHTVAWIDCASTSRSGRGIFQRANWSPTGKLQPHSSRIALTVPLDAPDALLNRYTVRAFNAVYNWLQKSGPRHATMHYAPFLYPLDTLGKWNRLYGTQGFHQYQCIIPAENEAAIEDLLRHIVKSGSGSFLAVLKTFGTIPSRGFLSFPKHGTTLALDFRNKGNETLLLLAELDQIVAQAGGRLYPAKDGRMPAHMFRAGYPELGRYLAQVDPAISSDFWKRVSS